MGRVPCDHARQHFKQLITGHAHQGPAVETCRALLDCWEISAYSVFALRLFLLVWRVALAGLQAPDSR